MFNLQRFELARKRRRLTAKSLSEKSGVSTVTLSRAINGKQIPEDDTITKLIEALEFPEEFFYLDDSDEISATSASFRSLSTMTARERDAALSSGSIAFEISDWVNQNYMLPQTDLVDLPVDENDPASAAYILRQHWGIGNKPIGNLVQVLETKGIRVFSLAEATNNVDAFSVWRNNEPFIFLNTYKTAERSRFDAAHELGHLVLHKHGVKDNKNAELQANMFASSFLMPADDVRTRIPHVRSLERIISEKSRWKVSAAALCYRLHKLKLITDWQNKKFNIQLNRSFGRNEPNGIEREVSGIWKKIFDDLWSQKKSRSFIADQLHIPTSELENLVFGLVPTQYKTPQQNTSGPNLRLVE